MIFKRSSEINTSRRDLLWPDERTDRFRHSSDVSGAEEREKIDHLLRRRSLPSEGENLTILVHDVVDIDEYLFFSGTSELSFFNQQFSYFHDSSGR